MRATRGPSAAEKLRLNWRRRPLHDCPWCGGSGFALVNRATDCGGREKVYSTPGRIPCACVQLLRRRGTGSDEFRAEVVKLRDLMTDAKLRARIGRGRGRAP